MTSRILPLIAALVKGCYRTPMKYVASLGVCFLFAAATVSAKEAADWKTTRKAVKKIWLVPGTLTQKEKLVDALADVGHTEAIKLLAEWHKRSGSWSDKTLVPTHAEAIEKVENHERTSGSGPGKKVTAKVKKTWKTLCKQRDAAGNHVAVEREVRRRIAAAVAGVNDADATTWLASVLAPKLRRKKRDPHGANLRIAIVRCLFTKPVERVGPWVLQSAGNEAGPKERALAYAYLAKHKVPDALVLIVKGLSKPDGITARSAIAALKTINDPRAVKPLIDALETASPFLGNQIEAVLHWYTGNHFHAAHSVWMQWWTREGETWLDSASSKKKRHKAKRKVKQHTGTRATFYDIPTQSQSIVFVLDRSGSMKDPAGEKTRARKGNPPSKGPTTGGKKKDKAKPGKIYTPLAGDTRLAVAKAQLARSIHNLAADVEFALVFYSSDVKTWQAPPAMRPALAAEKEDATKWFSALKPQGSTQLFEALMTALKYADVPAKKSAKGNSARGGANTMFLLSDGSPTDASGDVLKPGVVEAQFQAFLKANEVYRCVVHTIGVGPSHNRSLMQRIARATGGQYRGVGMD